MCTLPSCLSYVTFIFFIRKFNFHCGGDTYPNSAVILTWTVPGSLQEAKAIEPTFFKETNLVQWKLPGIYKGDPIEDS